MGQEVPYGTMQNQDEGGLRRPDSVQEEMGPRSPQASSEQLAIRSDPDNDPTRSRPDETRHLSHMPPKSKAQDITPTSSLDCISDNNLVRHQAHIPSGVLDTANAENIDPGCSVVPPSPMRSSTKRSSSAALTQEQQRKRSKGASKGIPPIPYIHDTHDSKPCVTKKPSGFKNSASVSSSSSTTFVVGRSLCGSKTRSRQNLSSSRSRSGLRSTKVITTRSPPPSSGDFQGQTQLLSAGSSTGSIADRAFISSASSGSSAVGKSGDLPLVPPQDARLGGHRKMGDLLSASEPGPVVKTWSSINSYRPVRCLAESF